MLLSKEISIIVNTYRLKYYNNLGFDCKVGEEIKIPIELLSKCSNHKVDVKCDGCGKIIKVTFNDFNRRNVNGKYYCFDCKTIKTRKTCIEKYGVDNPFKVKEIQERQERTVLEKYGVKNVFQNEDIKLKLKETLIEKYGVDHPMRNQEIKERAVTNAQNTMSKNGYQMCSKNQKIIHSLYGGKLNFLFDRLWLDIFFEKDKIYFEYDGSGHDIEVKYGKMTEKDFKIKEIRRGTFLKSKGLKEFRIISRKDILPTNEVLISMKKFAFHILKNNISSYIIFDIDKEEIKYSNNLISYDYKNPIN